MTIEALRNLPAQDATVILIAAYFIAVCLLAGFAMWRRK